METTKDKLTAAKSRLAAFAKATPALMQGFGAVSKQATAAGSFTTGQKELIAVAIAVAKGCDDCILYHLDAARKHGVDEAALIEALEIAVEMGGGPAVMYGAKALDNFRS
ncbi:carboxymuconolactone decarboxylase family protein [Rhodobacter sp. 24-YEA-8]|uniref:carboxymuconolactone decarboxylase family protein n=1 Tax=Rhodobacter sp. 24-YEA-8 TaxID=1884310 RepID=UPI00089AA466|nr:carboxymuconolactone decarboxylase family protein [Rhodobacter sp. 24-YEA-8]SED16102.1 alkylhydroperoxidase AhpD family core domain-containing protein [Rhodobacter sp. 24-YEA-8]